MSDAPAEVSTRLSATEPALRLGEAHRRVGADVEGGPVKDGAVARLVYIQAIAGLADGRGTGSNPAAGGQGIRIQRMHRQRADRHQQHGHQAAQQPYRAKDESHSPATGYANRHFRYAAFRRHVHPC
jgi:hypothetical protein